MTTLPEIMDKLPPERRRGIEERAQEVIGQEMTLRDLRKARAKTQAHIAQKLRSKQENVSRIEKRTDLLLSTLTGYAEAMGGKLRVVAEFPERPPVVLTGIGDLDAGFEGK